MRSIVFAALLATLLSGCGGDGFQRVPVAGQVTQNGKPVELADILFVSRPGQEIGKRPQTGTRIVNGKFSIPQKYGPLPGPQLAKVIFLKEVTRQPDPGSDELHTKPSYNTTGFASIEIDISDSGNTNIVLEIDDKKLSKGGEGI